MRTAFAVTRSLEKAKARYPWAKAWVQISGGFWCFEDKKEAERLHPGLVRTDDEPPALPSPRRKRR